MRGQHIASIRAACIKANPDRQWRNVQWGHEYEGEPVRLADVLLAINVRFEGTAHLYSVDDLGGFYRDKHVHMQCYWNFRRDDLTEQSDETIKFLADLLA